MQPQFWHRQWSRSGTSRHSFWYSRGARRTRGVFGRVGVMRLSREPVLGMPVGANGEELEYSSNRFQQGLRVVAFQIRPR